MPIQYSDHLKAEVRNENGDVIGTALGNEAEIPFDTIEIHHPKDGDTSTLWVTFCRDNKELLRMPVHEWGSTRGIAIIKIKGVIPVKLTGA